MKRVSATAAGAVVGAGGAAPKASDTDADGRINQNHQDALQPSVLEPGAALADNVNNNDWANSKLTAALGIKTADRIVPAPGYARSSKEGGHDQGAPPPPTIIHTTSRTTCLAPGQANILKKWMSTPIATGPVQVWVWTDTGIKAWISSNLEAGTPVSKAIARTQNEWTTTYKKDGVSVAWNATRWRGVYLADMIRYLAVYVYGGVYMDSDVEPMQPFDAVMDACPTALFWEPRVYRGGARWGEDAHKALLNIAVLVAKQPQSPVIGEILLQVVEKLNALPHSDTKRPNPVYSTGPNPAAKALYKLKEGGSEYSSGTSLAVVNRTYFYPALTQQQHPPGQASDAAADRQQMAVAGGDGIIKTNNVLCEIDHPDSDLLFEHRFFCTYCDRGPKHDRAEREKLPFESVLDGPNVRVVYPLVPDSELCKKKKQ